MLNDTQPQIFLSYAWANNNIADEIDNDFISVGITFQRDVRDVKYTESIKEFMQRIGKSDFVVMLISDEYIKSENCMYEVTELLSAHEFEERILPVTLENVDIFGKSGQEKYYDYWLEKLEDAKRLMSKHTHEKTIEDKKKVENIYNYLGIFFQKITDLKSEKYEHLKSSNYKPMLDKIGFDENEVLEMIIKTSEIEDKEDQELAIEELLKKYPENKYVLFQKAYYADNNKLYKKAKKYYEELLDKYSQYADAHNNLANLFTVQFSDFEKAKKHYERAIEINPKYAAAHNNLAKLLGEYLTDYTEAKKHFEMAIEINPKYARAYNSLAILLDDHFSDYEGAKKNYKMAIETNPEYTIAHNNFALLLKDHFSDYEHAKKHFEKAIEIDSQYFKAYNNLAALLEIYFFDYEAARKHYEQAIEINPNYELAKKNLADLIKEHFS